jgi:hypothetical protein
MYLRRSAIIGLALAMLLPSMALGKSKKKPLQKAMLENMQAVPCGAKERGLTGLGSVFASAGITAVNSNEKLCPQYLLRTDDMEYRVRPTHLKHAALLPVGEEGEFKIKKDHLYFRAGDQDRKMREYQVVSMQPLNTGDAVQDSSYKAPSRPLTTTRPKNSPDAANLANPTYPHDR